MDQTLFELADQLKSSLGWVASLENYVPAELDLSAMLRFALLFAAVSLLFGCIGRAIFGKRSGLNHALSSAMGILCIYAVTVVIYTFEVTKLSSYLSPLPFVAFTEEYLILLPLSSAEFADICSAILSMVILAFLVNLIDTFIPKGKSVIGWYLLRFLTVALAMVAHFIVTTLIAAFLPNVLVTYAPIILLGILVASVIVGLVSLIVGFLISTVNPVLGVLTTFFFHNVVGKQLSKSVLTTAVLTGVFYLLEHFGYGVILISSTALVAYIPLILVLLVLWYVIGHIL